MPFVPFLVPLPPPTTLRPTVCHPVNVRCPGASAVLPCRLTLLLFPLKFRLSGQQSQGGVWQKSSLSGSISIYQPSVSAVSAPADLGIRKMLGMKVNRHRPFLSIIILYYSLNDTVKLLFAEDSHIPVGAPSLYANTRAF